MKSFWKSKMTILLLILSILIPLIVIIISYCLKIEEYNITGAIALFGVYTITTDIYHQDL